MSSRRLSHLIVPSLPDLFAGAAGQVRSERRPALGPVLYDQLAHFDVILFRPRAFDYFVLGLLPAVW
jgi:hypothetical protein